MNVSPETSLLDDRDVCTILKRYILKSASGNYFFLFIPETLRVTYVRFSLIADESAPIRYRDPRVTDHDNYSVNVMRIILLSLSEMQTRMLFGGIIDFRP